MNDPRQTDKSGLPPPATAADRARLVRLLGRLLAEAWLARQHGRPSPPPARGDPG